VRKLPQTFGKVLHGDSEQKRFFLSKFLPFLKSFHRQSTPMRRVFFFNEHVPPPQRTVHFPPSKDRRHFLGEGCGVVFLTLEVLYFSLLDITCCGPWVAVLPSKSPGWYQKALTRWTAEEALFSRERFLNSILVIFCV